MAATTDTVVEQPAQQQIETVKAESIEQDQKQAVAPKVNSKQVLSVLATAAKRLNLESRLASLKRYLQRVRNLVWFWIEELFEEFQPWLKWIIFDAVFTLVIGQIVKYLDGLRPLFEAVGWA